MTTNDVDAAELARLERAEVVIARLRDWLKAEDDLRKCGFDHNAGPGPHSAEEALTLCPACHRAEHSRKAAL